ncbi:hypothetical protein [Pararhizobium haloflavum]|uniref:hypothetical protein n=1 Tax=Pararhizobium haloflavum TaxID=2037914 RepID=UPI0013000387|nr:hypothetical protein [Pararhizobium haloflavum]
MAQIAATIVFLNLVLVASALSIGPAYDIPPSAFYRDPVAVFDGKFAIGWFSNLGGLLWFATAAVLIFTALAAQAKTQEPLLVFGLLTAALGGDDLFMLHDGLLPFLGLPGVLLYGLYAVVLLTWLYRYLDFVVGTQLVYILTGGFLLMVSAGSDIVVDSAGLHGDTAYLIEDVAKLSGIMFWSVYGVSTAWAAMRANRHPTGETSLRFDPTFEPQRQTFEPAYRTPASAAPLDALNLNGALAAARRPVSECPPSAP